MEIYGYCVIEIKTENAWWTDYQDETHCKIHKVRMFATEKMRDAAAKAELERSRRNGWYDHVEKFVTKGEQGGLAIGIMKKIH